MTQPIVSSRIAEATMIWPRSRRMKFISRTTTATICTEEIDSAVPRKRAAIRRCCGFGSIEGAFIAGILVGIYYNQVYPTMGAVPAYKSLAIIVVGGLGSVPGAVVASLLLLRFWEMDDPMKRTGMQNGFLANIGVLGGLLLLLQNAM